MSLLDNTHPMHRMGIIQKRLYHNFSFLALCDSFKIRRNYCRYYQKFYNAIQSFICVHSSNYFDIPCYIIEQKTHSAHLQSRVWVENKMDCLQCRHKVKKEQVGVTVEMKYFNSNYYIQPVQCKYLYMNSTAVPKKHIK